MTKHLATEKLATENLAAPTFESAMAELERLVAQMESGQLPLEQSLTAYKRGAELLGFCQQALAEVEQQVRVLNEANQLSPFNGGDARDA
ncbi:exodeoxyribonuclease VII small subunit [Methylobacillus flagellatus]|uniref:exodeoxyribonuclease VII small subunit n=1 Tax=Methylobacillus flagellatus TaxID=405 RepID=UPI0010F6ECF1|nr:exodeoxyribonuclease VII small subunit [Methylobacillus flagellatus]